MNIIGLLSLYQLILIGLLFTGGIALFYAGLASAHYETLRVLGKKVDGPDATLILWFVIAVEIILMLLLLTS